MTKEISKFLKIVFLIHFVLGIFLGFVFLFIPEVWCEIAQYTISDKGAFRLLGAASFALGSGSFIAYRSNNWEIMKPIILIELVWLIFANGAMLFWLIAEQGPWAGWVIEIMFIGFLVAFLYTYFQEKR